MATRKIFFVLGSFKLGGTERTASRIGLELLRRGYDVKFLLINGMYDYNEPLLIDNSIVLSKPGYISTSHKFFIVYINLFRIVWKEKPWRLISFSLGINKLLFFLFYPNTIFRIESNIFIFKKKLYRRYLINFFSVFPHISKVVIPSSGLLEASKKYFFASKKLILINNPLDISNIANLADADISDFPQLKGYPFIVSAGRLNASKGFDQLIKVFKSSKLSSIYKLLILGRGDQCEELKSLISREQLDSKVIMGGYQENPYRFLSKARFLVLNSAHESFGNVLIESFACEIPVASNDCDFGPRHIIKHDINGILYNRRNEEMFILALEKLAFDDEYYFVLKRYAAESKYLYDVNVITDMWIEKIICK